MDHEESVRAIEVGGYFRGREGKVKEWLFSAAPPEVREGLPPFRVPVFMRTLSSWLNGLVDAGFVLERFGEPYPSDEAIRERPRLQSAPGPSPCSCTSEPEKPAVTEG